MMTSDNFSAAHWGVNSRHWKQDALARAEQWTEKKEEKQYDRWRSKGQEEKKEDEEEEKEKEEKMEGY